MSALILKTFFKFRRQFTLATVAAGCVIGSSHLNYGFSQDVARPDSLDAIFQNEDFNITSIPPVGNTGSATEQLPIATRSEFSNQNLKPLRQSNGQLNGQSNGQLNGQVNSFGNSDGADGSGDPSYGVSRSSFSLPAQQSLRPPGGLLQTRRISSDESVDQFIKSNAGLTPAAAPTTARMVVLPQFEHPSQTADQPQNDVSRAGASSLNALPNHQSVSSKGPIGRLDLNSAWQNSGLRPISQEAVDEQAFHSQAGYQQESGNGPTARPVLYTSEPSAEPKVEPTRQPHPVSSLAKLNTASLTGLHQIQNVPMDEFETGLLRTWGSRMKTASSPDGRFVRVEIPNQVNQRMSMVLDRQTQMLSFEGDAGLLESWHRIVNGIDYRPITQPDGSVKHIALFDSTVASKSIVQQVAYLVAQDEPATAATRSGQDQAMLILPPGSARPNQREILPGGDGLAQGLQSKVTIVEDPQTGVLTLIGNKEDLDIVRKIIQQIAAESDASQPVVQRIALDNVQSQVVAEQIQELYDASYAASKGTLQITALPSPNSLIVVGQPEGIESVRKIVQQMDVQSDDPVGNFKTFRLKNISANDAKTRLDVFFGQLNSNNQGDNQIPSAPIVTIADYRSNVIAIKGSRQFIQEAERFLEEIDVDYTDAANVVKIIPLKNTLAEEMAIVLQDAINGQQTGAGRGYNPNQQSQLQEQATGQISPEESHLRSTSLTLKTIGEDGKVISSGILFDVRITADRNSNSLVVSAPESSMELVVALAKQLDRVPDAETQIKVFQIMNGDAETLLTMLQTLFQSATQQGGGQVGGATTSSLSQLPLQAASATDGASLVNLRFSVDTRTNSIIASGPGGDLQVVEDLLNRLDEQDANERQTIVYRLSNAPAIDVADALNAYLDARSTINEEDPRAVGALNQTNREVIVVEEVVSNSLIIQARPEYLAEIHDILQALDRRPPMVKVKVLIAEVDLNRLEEFGVDLGVQDSLLFDRGTSVGAGNAITGGIGFPFNGSATANQNATFQETLAGQALSNLGTGRVNGDLGYGGLVVSAGNESISVLMRALKDKQCGRVLSKPHIMTIENLQGRVSIGAEVPRISGTTNTNFGITQDIEFVDVGVILEVTPRVSPDGMIVMAVNAKKSSVGPESTGITIAIGADGTPIRSPQIIETEANTTLMARSGQTVVFAGLIQETKNHVERGTPFLSDLPVIGPLFKFESDQAVRTELLIIMTPYLVNGDESIDGQNYDEMDRMHWCLCDVAEVYGNTDYEGHVGDESAVQTYYPDSDPTGMQMQQQFQQPQVQGLR